MEGSSQSILSLGHPETVLTEGNIAMTMNEYNSKIQHFQVKSNSCAESFFLIFKETWVILSAAPADIEHPE